MKALGSLDVAAATSALRVLANPSRLRIASLLLEGELPVARIEATLGLRQPNLSQQLAELREAGLVTTRREAKSVFYRLIEGVPARLVRAIVQAFGAATSGDAGAAQADPETGAKPQSGSGQAGAASRPRQAAVFAIVGDRT